MLVVVAIDPFGGVVEGELSLPKSAEPIFLARAAALPPVLIVGAEVPVFGGSDCACEWVSYPYAFVYEQ